MITTEAEVYILYKYSFCCYNYCVTGVIAQWYSVRLTTGRSWVLAPAESYQRLLKWYSLPSHLALDIREWSGKVKHAELPVNQPPAVAFTAFADVWPRATGNGDRRRPMRHWCWRNFDFFDYCIAVAKILYFCKHLYQNRSTQWRQYEPYLAKIQCA